MPIVLVRRIRFAVPAMILAAMCTAGSVHAQTVFSTDFESGVPSEFSGVTTLEAVQGYTAHGFAGQMLRNSSPGADTTTLTLTGLPKHESIGLEFLLAIIDSWDGDPCGVNGPDSLVITVDGVEVFNEVLENSTCGLQSYVPATGVTLARREDLGFNTAPTFFLDSAYDMGMQPELGCIAHTAESVTITWGVQGIGWDGEMDESWGLDNVAVILDMGGCLGDLNDSGSVTSKDLLLLFSGWGGAEADLDCDGTAGSTDLIILLGAWGECAG